MRSEVSCTLGHQAVMCPECPCDVFCCLGSLGCCVLLSVIALDELGEYSTTVLRMQKGDQRVRRSPARFGVQHTHPLVPDAGCTGGHVSRSDGHGVRPLPVWCQGFGDCAMLS